MVVGAAAFNMVWPSVGTILTVVKVLYMGPQKIWKSCFR